MYFVSFSCILKEQPQRLPAATALGFLLMNFS